MTESSSSVDVCKGGTAHVRVVDQLGQCASGDSESKRAEVHCAMERVSGADEEVMGYCLDAVAAGRAGAAGDLPDANQVTVQGDVTGA